MNSGKRSRYTKAAAAEQSWCWDHTESWSAVPLTPSASKKDCKMSGALLFGKGQRVLGAKDGNGPS